MENFSYDPQKDYKNDPKVIIAEMKKMKRLWCKEVARRIIWFMQLRRQNQSTNNTKSSRTPQESFMAEYPSCKTLQKKPEI